MRTLFEIPDKDLDRLTQLSKERKVSRSHLVRCAIREYLEAQPADSLEEFFGIWAEQGVDGLELERKMRAEWDHRP